MTVAEFIEWLKTQDQGAIVQCIQHHSPSSYHDSGGSISQRDFTPDLTEYDDFRHDAFKGLSCFDKRYLLIGVTNS